jgi:hypothetical protein
VSSHRHRRTDLFLVRVWTESNKDGRGKSLYGGRVQRVVDGESRQFDDWEGLVDALLVMLSATKGGPLRPGRDEQADQG